MVRLALQEIAPRENLTMDDLATGLRGLGKSKVDSHQPTRKWRYTHDPMVPPNEIPGGRRHKPYGMARKTEHLKHGLKLTHLVRAICESRIIQPGLISTASHCNVHQCQTLEYHQEKNNRNFKTKVKRIDRAVSREYEGRKRLQRQDTAIARGPFRLPPSRG